MATNYYNVLDRPLGLAKDSIGRLTYSQPTPFASIELGNTLAGTLKAANLVNLYNVTTFTGVATFTTDSLATGADALGAATLNSLPAKASGGFIYVGANLRFGMVAVVINAANGTDNTLAVEYYDKSTGAWTAVSNLTDGTISGADSFAASGTIKYTIPDNWGYGKLTDLASAADSVVNATTEYFWVRLSWNAAFDSATSTTSILPNIGMRDSDNTLDYAATHVAFEIVSEFDPGHADAALVECIDATAISGNANHTGIMQTIGAALLWRPGSRTATSGACFAAWPTYYIGTDVTVTNLYGITIANSGGTLGSGAAITNYTGINIGAMAHNVTTLWYGIRILGFTGTSNVANGVALAVCGLDIGTCTGSVGSNGIKVGIQVGVMSGVGLINYGILVNTPASGTNNVGLRVAGGSTAAIWSNGAILCSSSSGIGYGANAGLSWTGAGGTVTQATNKSTGVTINTACGEITMNNEILNAGAEATFVVTNSACAASDAVIICVKSGATAGAYIVSIGAVAAGAFRVNLSNVSGSNLTETVVLTFAIIKGVTS